MCFNKEVSFVISLIGITLLIKLAQLYKEDPIKNEKYICFILLMTGLVLMQISEFIVHCYPNNKSLGHQIGSLMIPITLLIQVILALVYVVVYCDLPVEMRNFVVSLCAFYFILFFYVLFVYYVPNFGHYNSNPLCKKGCRLEWIQNSLVAKNNEILSNIMGFMMFLILFIEFYYGFGPIAAFLLFLSLALSIFYSWIYSRNMYAGSLWCIFVVFIMILIIINYL
jgi:hypothetical protein